MTNKHTSLEKYTSHTLFEMVAKGLRKGYVWEVSWWLNRLQHIDSKFFFLSSTSFSFYWAAQAGVLRAQALYWELVLTASNCKSNFNCHWLQLNEPVCGTGLYNCLTSICFLWTSHLHRIQAVHMSRRYLRPDAPVSRLTARSKVNMLQKALT